MPSGQGAARKQLQRIVFWFADYLKLIAGRLSIADLERIQSNTQPEQARREMKQMGSAFAVHDFGRCEVGALNPTYTIGFSDLGVKAFGTKLSITRVYGTIVGDVVIGHGSAAAFAAGLLLSFALHLIHFQLSIPACTSDVSVSRSPRKLS